MSTGHQIPQRHCRVHDHKQAFPLALLAICGALSWSRAHAATNQVDIEDSSLDAAHAAVELGLAADFRECERRYAIVAEEAPESGKRALRSELKLKVR